MTRLIGKRELMESHPALNNKWRIEWLVRSRQIPIVKIGGRIYFDEDDIESWILNHSFNGENEVKDVSRSRK